MLRLGPLLLLLGVAVTARAASPASGPDAPYFAIRVVDAQTGRGVPAIRIRTTSISTYWTDSAGYAAFLEPGLMVGASQPNGVFVWVEDPEAGQYQYPADGFGNRGTKVYPKAGGSVTLKVNRLYPAQRLYRFTGYGQYRDSALMGLPNPLANASGGGLINADVTGQDSTQAAFYKGAPHLFWGDTNTVDYPLGSFDTTGAVVTPVAAPASAGATADVTTGLDVKYFGDGKGFVQHMVPVPFDKTSDDGPVWVGGTTTTGDGATLGTVFTKLNRAGGVYKWGYALWNDTATQFGSFSYFPLDSPFYNSTMGSQAVIVSAPAAAPSALVHAQGAAGPAHGAAAQPARQVRHWRTDEASEGVSANETWVVMTNGYPLVRAPATAAGLTNVSRWQAYTCLVPGSSLQHPVFDRDPSTGRLIYAWRYGAPPVLEPVQRLWELLGLIKPSDEPLLNLTAASGAGAGQRIMLHRTALLWSDHKAAWLLVGEDAGVFGDIYVAVSTRPTMPEGPYRVAHLVVHHSAMNFYNPCVYPWWTATLQQGDGGGEGAGGGVDRGPASSRAARAAVPVTAEVGSGQVIVFSGTYVNTFTSAPKTPFYDYNGILYALDLDSVPW